MAVNTVIFDFDGTVADTNQVIINSWQHAYRTIRGREEEISEIVKSFGEPLDVTMKKVFPSEKAHEAMEIYRSYQVKHFKEMIELFPGMKELFQKLKVLGYRVAIVTSRKRNTTVEGLIAFGLMDYIDYIVTCDDTDKHKPDPEPVNLVLEHFNIEPSEAIMVGDSMFDIKCAHNAGVKAVLVGWHVAVSEADLKGSQGPEHVIEEAMELVDII